MIHLKNIYLQYGGRILLDNINWPIKHDQFIGLVGKNGAGKSTLLKIIARRITPDQGTVLKAKNDTIGYLTQDIPENALNTVFIETMGGLRKIVNLKNRISELENELSARDDYHSDNYMSLLNELSTKTHNYEIAGGYEIEAKVEPILTGLGFPRDWFHKPLHELSGGWQMRVQLARLLLLNPTYLLLDEPANHLDMDAIIWLESWLRDYSGTVIIISHDKRLLNKLTTQTVEISNGSLSFYHTNYDGFIEEKKVREEIQQSAFDQQQREIKHKEQLIEKFRAKANKAKMAQSLIKQLDKMEKVHQPGEQDASVRLSFRPAPRSGKEVVKIKNLHFSYPETPIFSGVDFQVFREEKVGFVGPNGKGKSTLMKLIAGELAPDRGTIELGYNTHMGYYRQNQSEILKEEHTVLESVSENAPESLRNKIRTILGAFLFSGEEVDKKISVLSGGERARVALAKIMLHDYNLMLFDEPTNHLDIQSKNILKEALREFDGTMVLVSHDRDFMSGLCEKIVEVSEHRLKPYLGGIDYYLSKRKPLAVNQENNKISSPAAAPVHQDQKQIKSIESKIRKLEKEIEQVEKKMGENGFYETESHQQVLKRYDQLKKEKDNYMQQWEELVEAL